MHTSSGSILNILSKIFTKFEREKPGKNIPCWAFFIAKTGNMVKINVFLYIIEIEEDL